MATGDPFTELLEKVASQDEAAVAEFVARYEPELRVIARSWLRRLLLWPYLHRPTVMSERSVASLVEGVGTHGVLRVARAVARMRVDRWLHEVEVPLLAIGGEHDLVAPLDQLAALARAVPAAETVVLGGVGHMVMLERPDAFTDEVLRWVGEHPTVAGA